MRELSQPPRLLGYVQLRVGTSTYALPVQSARFDKDAVKPPGGFFVQSDDGQLGILVDSDASAEKMQQQIAEASAEAVRHISKRFLN
jgi:hypothetical protein